MLKKKKNTFRLNAPAKKRDDTHKQEWLKQFNFRLSFCRLSAGLLFRAKEERSGSESRSGLDGRKPTWADLPNNVAHSRYNASKPERLRPQPQKKGEFVAVHCTCRYTVSGRVEALSHAISQCSTTAVVVSCIKQDFKK